jgi:hypothetical protein
MERRYENSKIYKISNADCPDVYIGSTIQKNPLNRYYRHIGYGRKGKGHYGDIFKTDNTKFEIIDTCNFTSRRDLLMRERQWIDLTPNTTNLLKPCYMSEEERRKCGYARTLKYYRTDRGKVKKKLQNQRYQKKKLERLNALGNQTTI